MIPVSIRWNNPGAINRASWLEQMPGYLSSAETTPGNNTARFDTPEHGCAAYYRLLQLYADAGANTPRTIVIRYGGSAQRTKYEEYLQVILPRAQMTEDEIVPLVGDDQKLLRFAKAMFHYEAGTPIDPPYSDEVILHGFNQVRGVLKEQEPAQPRKESESSKSFVVSLINLVVGLFQRK